MPSPNAWLTKTSQGDVYKRDYRSALVIWWMFAVGGVVASLWLSLTNEWWKGLFLLVVVVAPVVLLMWRVGVVPRLIVTAEGIEVHNPFRTTVFRWTEIRGFVVGRFLVVVPVSGDALAVRSIQTNMVRWLKGQVTESEGIAQRLNAELHDRVPTTRSDPLTQVQRDPEPEVISAKRKVAMRVVLAAIAWGVITVTLTILMEQ